jgi:hypothetical protein
MKTVEMEREGVLRTLPQLVTIDTFVKAGLVEVDPITLRRWCLSGEFPHGVKRGKHWFIGPRQFMAWFEGRDKRRHSSAR